MSTFATKSYDAGIPYTQSFDNSGGSDGKQTIYIGKAEPGSSKSAAKWQIQKLTLDANDNVTDIQWPGSSLDFHFIWNNRSSYTYS